MEGLTQGRMVHFVDKNGEVAPAIVSLVHSKAQGMVNLHVLDQSHTMPIRLQTSVPYLEEPEPGRMSWHWIPRA